MPTHSIAICEEDYHTLQTLKKKYGTFGNTVSAVLDQNAKSTDTIKTLKKEITSLKKDLKAKDKLIGTGFVNLTANITNNSQKVQVVNLNAPPPPPVIQAKTTPHILPNSTGIISGQYGMITEMKDKFGIMDDLGQIQEGINVKPSLVMNAKKG
jgi:hypothetical protein